MALKGKGSIWKSMRARNKTIGVLSDVASNCIFPSDIIRATQMDPMKRTRSSAAAIDHTSTVPKAKGEKISRAASVHCRKRSVRALEIVTPEILTFWTAAMVEGHRRGGVGNGGRLRANRGAEGGTRTPTGVTPPPPQDGVSTSSTTSARTYDGNCTPDLSTEIWPWVVGHFARDPYT